MPITVAYCKECGEVYHSAELFENAAKVVEKEGASAWFEKDIKEFLPDGAKCAKCGSTDFRKETDILDVWIDSGVSHAVVLGKRDDLPWPADIYIEGSDQYRGWFHSSLLTAVATKGQSPYRTVITHGFVLDGKGNKMSKSAGNVVAPQDIIKRYGAEVLRLWASQLDYKGDVRISEDIIKRSADTYRKIRNTARYLLGNLFDFNPEKDYVPFDKMLLFDRWALNKLAQLNNRVIKAYREYDFHLMYHHVLQFCTVDMSNFYLDILKDRLYCSKKESLERRSAQTALFEIVKNLAIIISPVLTFTADEIWQYIPEFEGKTESVHLAYFNNLDFAINDSEKLMFNTLIEVREEVLKALEEARKEKVIGHPLDAEVSLVLKEKQFDTLKPLMEELNRYFIVSKVNVEKGDKLSISVAKASGEKCLRCWNYGDLNSDGLCERCEAVLKGE